MTEWAGLMAGGVATAMWAWLIASRTNGSVAKAEWAGLR